VRPLGAPAILALAAAAMGAQFAIQQPLARANAVRATRRLHTAPSSLGFRLAAGGVTEAAGDALWLTVLPNLGKSWTDPMKKAAWIEGVVTVMTDANPRALFPLVYGAGAIENIRKRHPAFQRVLKHGIEIEKRGPFGVVVRPNADDWHLPMEIGMNLYLYGNAGEKEETTRWLRVAAEKPTCPSLILDTLAALRSRQGNDLVAWDVWMVRLSGTKSRERQQFFLREADQARVDVLRKWALAAEKRLDRWPATIEEILASAPPATAEELRQRPDRRAALVDGVVLRATTRDVEVPSLTAAREDEARAELRQLARSFEAEKGRRPGNLREIEDSFGARYPRPPRHGTRWEFDPVTGEPAVVFDLSDPRLKRPVEVYKPR